jgi:phosphoglycolate phosphatase
MEGRMKLPPPKAVIFDWDDTLLDTWQAALVARNAAFVAMGHEPWTDAEARARAGASGRDLFMQLFGERWEEAVKVYYDTFHAVAPEKIRVFDQVDNILQKLHEQKIYLAVVSNKRGNILRKEAQDYGFDKYFGRVIGAGDAAADKPDPAPVFMALEGSGIAPGPNVWFVGDSHIDMICALNAGCTPILIETKPPPEDLLSLHPPAHRLGTHDDFMEFISEALRA